LRELRGDDASTPALVEIATETAVPTVVKLGGMTAANAYHRFAIPLNVLAEREPGPLLVPALVATEASLIQVEELAAAGMSASLLSALITTLRNNFAVPAVTAQDAAALSPASVSLLAAVRTVSFNGVATARTQAAALPARARGHSGMRL
jgi:hypothetical protein